MKNIYSDKELEKVNNLIAWMVGKMAVNNIEDRQMAAYMGIHPNTFANKKKNGKFSFFELATAFTVLHADQDIINNLMTY